MQVLSRLGVPGVHVDDEVGVLGEQGHLALGVAPVGAVRVGIEQFPDGEPVGGFGAGGRWMDTHADAQVVRIGVQRLADEFVHRAGPVVLRGVDVVHPGRDGRTEYPQRLVAIPRRPEDPVAGELHRAVPGPVHAPRAEREGPAERARSGSRHALRRRRRARPHR